MSVAAFPDKKVATGATVLGPVIPETLMTHLLELRPVLTKQGVVQPHHGMNRASSFRLRYRIRQTDQPTVHHSLELGSATVATAVKELLKQWRAENPRPKKKASRPPLTDAEKENIELMRLARQKAKAAGGGRAFQKRAADSVVQAMNGGVQEMMNFIIDQPYLTPPKRGRPRKSRLW